MAAQSVLSVAPKLVARKQAGPHTQPVSSSAAKLHVTCLKGLTKPTWHLGGPASPMQHALRALFLANNRAADCRRRATYLILGPMQVPTRPLRPNPRAGRIDPEIRFAVGAKPL